MDTTEKEETKNYFCFCNQATVPYLGFILYFSTGYLVIILHTLQKKKVLGQLKNRDKYFKICYVYGKRKPK